MYLVLALLVFSLSACSHELKPNNSRPDARDDDRDGSPDGHKSTDLSLNSKDRQLVTFGDFSSPSGCSTTLPASAPTNLTGDCSSTKSWVCNSQCEGFHRLTCYKGKVFQREIRCNKAGLCECKVGTSGTPTRCIGVPIQDSRTGCGRCMEVLVHGCCKPTT